MNLTHACYIALVAVLCSACGGDYKSASSSTSLRNAPPTPAQTQTPAAAPAPTVKKPKVSPKLDMALIKGYFGSEPSAPKVDTKSTVEQVALGKMLYHDASLSKNGNVSCASCHDLADYGQDGRQTSPGSDGKNGERNSPTTLNAFRQIAQFRDGRADTVEAQAILQVLNPSEHGITDDAELLQKIGAKQELVAAFGQAFPGEGSVSIDNFKNAIGAFERTLVTRSPFDDFLDGSANALTTEQKIGLKLFIDVGCTQCHTSRLVGGNLYQKLGLLRPYPTEDTGRMRVTKSEADKYLFKVPSLLNVAETAPYYHDGKMATLAEAVKNMAAIQLNKDLSADEVLVMVAFLKSLTGTVPAEALKK